MRHHTVETGPLVSIIIVNYNGEKFLKSLFQSLFNQTFISFEVIVVDNASIDNSVKVIEEILSISKIRIKLVRNNRNAGFCISNNQGLRLARGLYIVFLNNDTLVSPTWLQELIDTVESKDKPAAAVSRIVNEGSNLADYGTYYDLYGASLEKTTFSDDIFFYGCGASLLIRKDVLEKIGRLDEELFMYQDDPDLCWRIRLLNQKIVCSNNSICYHLKSSPTIAEANLRMSVWEFYYAHSRNRIRILLKNYAYKNLFKRLPLVVALVQMRALLLAVVNRNPNYLTAGLKGLIWNGRMLSSTLKERYKLQSIRLVDDEEIEKFMLPYSIELSSFRLFCLRER
jgi:GT2 family glycosyltransferase